MNPLTRTIVLVLALISLEAGQLTSASYSSLNQFQAGRRSPALGRFFFPFRFGYAWPSGPFYLPNLITTSTITATSVVPTIFTRTIDAYCISGANSTCAVRRKRTLLEEDQLIYIDGQAFQPSDVASMLATERPTMVMDNVLFDPDSPSPAATAWLEGSMPSAAEGRLREGRAKAGSWFFATTTTVTLTAVTIVNSTNAELIPISIAGCIPACLTTLAFC